MAKRRVSIYTYIYEKLMRIGLGFGDFYFFIMLKSIHGNNDDNDDDDK